MATETELKLRIAPADVARLLAHPLLQELGTGERLSLCGTYYDTPDRVLQANRIGLRVRREGTRWIQAVKTAGSALGGLHQRQEWEAEVPDPQPVFAALPLVLQQGLFADNTLWARIIPWFTSEFERRLWLWRGEDGSVIELCLDQGRIFNQTHSVPISEVELELQQGPTERVYQLALALLEQVPLVLENTSKAARGYALHAPSSPSSLAHVPLPLLLKAKDSAEQAFIDIIQFSVAQLQSHESDWTRSQDSASAARRSHALCQMRLSLRGLRAALFAYKKLMPVASDKSLLIEIKWLNEELGLARDWARFNDSMEHLDLQLGEPQGLSDLGGTVAAIQAHYEQRVSDVLNAPRYTRLLLHLGGWLLQRPWRVEASPEQLAQWTQPAPVFASRRLDKLRKRLNRWGKQLPDLDDAGLHALWVSCRHLDHAAHFFQSFYPTTATRRYLAQLAELRATLNLLSAAMQAKHLLAEAGIQPDCPAYQFLAGWYAAHRSLQIGLAQTQWQALRHMKPFWRD